MVFLNQSPDFCSKQVCLSLNNLYLYHNISGPDTILSSHLVGLYCNKEIIGQSYGETLAIAEEMAARDALRNIFQTTEYSAPPSYRLPEDMTAQNSTLNEYKTEPRNIVMC